VAVKVSEVELGPGIVACEHLIIVKDDSVDLVGVVELSTLVLVDDQWQERRAIVFRPSLAGRSSPRSILASW
jgi:hypothetical protein